MNRVRLIVDHYRAMSPRRRVATVLALAFMLSVDQVLRSVLWDVGLPGLFALAAHYGLMP